MNPRYCAVILDKSSKRKLIHTFEDLGILTEDYEAVADHMTIEFGKGVDDFKLLGKKVALKAISYGFNNKVIAVKVLDDGISKNKIPHITIGIDSSSGGCSYMSNNLKFENEINPIVLYGTIRNV